MDHMKLTTFLSKFLLSSRGVAHEVARRCRANECVDLRDVIRLHSTLPKLPFVHEHSKTI